MQSRYSFIESETNSKDNVGRQPCTKPQCHHNSPYVDEQPQNFVRLPSHYYDGVSRYQCKHCGAVMTFSLFNEVGYKFIEEYNKLNR